MVAQFTIKAVLGKAIQKEIGSQRLYSKLSQTVKDKASKDVLHELAQQERGHQQLLEQYRRGVFKEGTLSHGHAIDYKIAERLDQPEISSGMNLKDIFMLAANREKLSHEFYLGLAKIHPDGEVKRLLEELSAQELEHKQRVEFLYTEVAFPQTDGG